MCKMQCSRKNNKDKKENTKNNKNNENNKLTLFNDKCKSNLLLFDGLRNVLIRTNEQEFKIANGGIVELSHFKIKIVNGTRQNLMSIKSAIYSIKKYEAEGLLEVFSLSFKATSAFTKIAYKIIKNESDVETNALIMDVLSMLIQHGSGTYNNWTPGYLIGFLARVYSIFTRSKKLLLSESLDTTMLVAGAIGLPEGFFNVLKKISLMTNKKIGDHPGLFLEGVQYISSFFNTLIMNVPWIPEIIKSICNKLFTFGDFQLQVMEMQNSLLTWKNDKKILSDVVFRNKIFKQKEQLESHPDTTEKLKTGLNFKIFYGEFGKMVSSAKAFEKCSRQEPVLIVLEGPPGVKKTVALLRIIKLLNMSVYTHIVKSVEDGKDHYDGYNNEDVFVMDDVGQQGVSQWRTIINMVSSIRMPLECASVDLKDTKYFDSKIIIVTTNNFSNLNGLTKSDGISDIKALWRRGQVFNFLNESTVEFKRFDVYKDKWTNIPIFNNRSLNIFKGDNLELSLFITAYIKRSVQYYNEIIQDIDLTDSQIIIAQDRIDEMLTQYYDAQSWVSATMTVVTYWKYIQDYMEDLLNNIYHFVCEHSNQASFWIVGVCLFQAYKTYFDYAKIGVNSEESNLEIINEWNSKIKGKGKLVEIKDSKVYIGESITGTLIDTVKKNVKLVKILLKNNNFEVSHCLVSGTKILLPAHVVFESLNTLILYNTQEDFVNENRALDHCSFKVVFDDKINDVAILEIPLLNKTPYKNISHYFKFKNKVARNPYFVWSGEPVKLEGTYVPSELLPKYKTRFGDVVIQEPLTYQMSGKGFCGSVIVDENAGVIGFHVAGDGEVGVSKIFSQSVMAKINNYLEDGFDTELQLDNGVKEKFSGMVANSTKISDGPKQTHLKLSKLADLHEETKRPANLRSLGEHTVKKRAVRMHKLVTTLPTEELSYMKEFLLYILPNFSPISEFEVIKGNDRLASINKDSVSGMDFPLEKESYFDFEKGECLSNFKEDLVLFRHQSQYRYPDKITQHHTLKDELRVAHKVEKPRTFGVDSLITQFEMKRLMGNLMIQLKEERWNNGLAIGLNPYKDWPRLYDILSSCKINWDGDIGEYDASVSPQIQNIVNEVVNKKFVGTEEDKNILERLLNLVIQSWVVAGNKLLFKTHGVLSGMWITNLFNSIYNRCYTAGWYYRNIVRKYGRSRSVSRFLHEVVDFVQGDDKICGARVDIDILNAITMRDYYMSCGMTFTDGEKGQVEYESKNLHDCIFLKRKFEFHDELKQIVGPLSMESITNSIRWYKDDNEEEEILKDKYHVYQRELYLHGKEGINKIKLASNFIKEKKINLKDLSMDYLRKTYLDDPDYWYNYVQRVNGKVY